MDVNQAIRTRRTIAKFRDEPVPQPILEAILSAGIWAPNHHSDRAVAVHHSRTGNTGTTGGAIR
jgi:nitroreductase